jgi:hypothetical protein
MAVPNIDLADLASSEGFVVRGRAAEDFAGASVSSAGDVNGDGYDDLLVGAWGRGYFDGEAYVIFGRAGGLSDVDLSLLTPDLGFAIRGGGTADEVGASVSCAGDINGDGYDDLIVGAPRGNEGGAASGQAYVVFGRASGFGTTTANRAVIDLLTLSPDQGFLLWGPDDSGEMGRSVSDAGDVNGDGFDDLLVGAPWVAINGQNQLGEAYVIFGHEGAFGRVNASGRAAINLARIQPENGFVIQGDPAHEQIGQSVSSAGDVNGDGFADLIIGAAPSVGVSGVGDEGAAYVLFGHDGSFGPADAAGRSVASVNELDFATGFAIHGSLPGDRMGWSVSTAGDINGDGFADLIVGGDDFYSVAYVLFGHGGSFADVDVANLAPGEGFVIRTAEFDQLGQAVSDAGDVNGDGFDDLIVGAPWSSGGGAQAGRAYVIFGHAGLFADLDLAGLTSAEGFVLEGAEAGLHTGQSVSAAGDIDGDGVDDIVIGAPGQISGNPDSYAYVIYGRQSYAPLTWTGGAGDDVRRGHGGDDALDGADGDDRLRGNLGDDALSGGGGADKLFGDGGADTLSGDDGDDIVRGLGGRDTLLGGDGADLLHGGAGQDTLTGGAGRDVFQFRDGDFGPTRGLADLITDFSHADHEKIQLHLADADTTTAGNQAFAWIGSGAFTGVAGQLRYAHAAGDTYVEGDLDGDGLADFAIALAGLHTLVVGDFVL